MPSRHAVKFLQPVPSVKAEAENVIVPADPSTLVPVYEQAFAYRERDAGPDSAAVARASANLGLFLLQIGKGSTAEASLRRALQIDSQNSDHSGDSDRENLADALVAASKPQAAFALLGEPSWGRTLMLRFDRLRNSLSSTQNTRTRITVTRSRENRAHPAKKGAVQCCS